MVLMNWINIQVTPIFLPLKKFIFTNKEEFMKRYLLTVSVLLSFSIFSLGAHAGGEPTSSTPVLVKNFTDGHLSR